MEFHEAANIFPLDEENLGELAKDIRKNGQLVPIELLDGKIIDGRRRFKACQLIGVNPVTKNVSPSDPIEYVLSLNLCRRHLTTSQAASCAVRARALREKLEGEAKERQKARKGRQAGASPDNCPDLNGSGDTRDRLGEMFGVSGKSVERAEHVHDRGIPELIAALDAGDISVNKAQYISSHSANLQKELLDSELQQPQKRQKTAKAVETLPDPDTDSEARKSRGKGVAVAHQAINLLSRIPKNDGLRKRGFQIVLEWVQRNLRKM